MKRPDFPIDVAAQLADVTTKMLEYWHTTRLLLPAIPAKARGVSRRYSFPDLVAIRVIRALAPVSTRTIEPLRAVVAYVCAHTGLSPTVALKSTTLATDGHDVFEISGSASLSSLRDRSRAQDGKAAPMLFVVPLDEIVAELQPKVRAYLDKQRAA